MKEDLEPQLKPTQLKELKLMGAMVARGESPSTIQSKWKKFITQVVRTEPTIDINGLI